MDQNLFESGFNQFHHADPSWFLLINASLMLVWLVDYHSHDVHHQNQAVKTGRPTWLIQVVIPASEVSLVDVKAVF